MSHGTSWLGQNTPLIALGDRHLKGMRKTPGASGIADAIVLDHGKQGVPGSTQYAMPGVILTSSNPDPHFFKSWAWQRDLWPPLQILDSERAGVCPETSMRHWNGAAIPTWRTRWISRVCNGFEKMKTQEMPAFPCMGLVKDGVATVCTNQGYGMVSPWKCLASKFRDSRRMTDSFPPAECSKMHWCHCGVTQDWPYRGTMGLRKVTFKIIKCSNLR